ncbi:UDP-3-O-(3-hydroxymyristoyl)glucosamine N-acyltransferase [Xylophilus sp. Kf1]|nr:UDP-3-O-(3-hydroxymyristoyl)glucosamine N-acyltransferase [Xylophilus sp. Kf1]
MGFKWLIGNGDYLHLAHHAWQDVASADDTLQMIEIVQHRDHSFDLAPLDALVPDDGLMFVAIDERFGNFKRMELMQAAMLKGFRLTSCIHPSAHVARDVVIGPNVFVGPNSVVGHGCRIDFNTVIHAGATIGPGTRLQSSCWIDAGVHIGRAVDIGTNGIVRTGASVADGVKVGRFCDLGWARRYAHDIANKTIFDVRYDEPIHVHEP